MNEISLPKTIQDMVSEYEQKRNNIIHVKRKFEEAVTDLKISCRINGFYGDTLLRQEPRLYEADMKSVLLKSAWRSVFNHLKMDIIATASDKKKFDMAMTNPPEFTFENIKATFGKYVENPTEHILRGVAEIFVQLDPAYKSHSKVKVGVEGLPKRIILNGMRQGKYGGWAHDRLKDMLTALQVFDGDGVPEPQIIWDILNEKITQWRGLTYKWFNNGNLHVHFDEHARNQINRALSAYYGDVLPDVEPSVEKHRPSTALSKDLQYYPTPTTVVDRVISELPYDIETLLEPSVGCGRLLEGLRRREFKNKIKTVAVEVNPTRAQITRKKGFGVLVENFLQLPENPIFDAVLMNPPFYGKHYQKHVEHAFKFLKVGGVLIAILPATAKYDHGFIQDHWSWRDLPVGSFSESGTNVPTGFVKIVKKC